MRALCHHSTMFGRSGSIQLARILGIRVGVDFSWFVVLFLVIFWLSDSFQETLGSSDTTAYLTAVASALLLFASIVVHELGHALAARRHGIDVAGITISPLGGFALMSRESRTPREELEVAGGGPARDARDRRRERAGRLRARRAASASSTPRCSPPARTSRRCC